MNDEIFSMLKESPHAMLAGAVIYLILANRRIELRLDDLTRHFQLPPTPKRKFFRAGASILVGAFFLVATSGCAVVSNKVRSEEPGTNGIVTKVTSSRVYTFWDASAVLGKLRVSNGKTHSIGAEGLDEKSASTNALALVHELTALVTALTK